ncbi:SDR family NAD(P)-dependent oxidoreductase [Lederbergia ruris]|uniref:SDR family NAD(P)-dependent oxidoreductase n=1 Tax=Lederbergia ruris TaxID=217495 RepID=UPI0039A254DF
MKYFILTGASRGIGESICEKLLLKDHHVICVSRKRNDSLISLANSRNAKLDYFEYDLSNLYVIEELMRKIFEKVDSSVAESLFLINNAGLVFSQKIEETEPGSIINLMNVNLLSPMILTSSFIKHAEQYDVEKRILNVSSGSSFNLSPGGSCYSTSKAGLETFTKSIGIETEYEDLKNFADVDYNNLKKNKDSGAIYRTLSISEYLKVYTRSSLDGYRRTKRDKKDQSKIEVLNELLHD